MLGSAEHRHLGYDKRADDYYPGFRTQVAAQFCTALTIEPVLYFTLPDARWSRSLPPIAVMTEFSTIARYKFLARISRARLASLPSRSPFEGRYGIHRKAMYRLTVLTAWNAPEPWAKECPVAVNASEVADVVSMLALQHMLPARTRLKWALDFSDRLMYPFSPFSKQPVA